MVPTQHTAPNGSIKSGAQAQAGALDCMFIHSASDMVFVLEKREGRFPMQVSLMRYPIIGWRCGDGADEFIDLSEGTNGQVDYDRFVADYATESGVLVAEIDDMANPDIDAATYHAISAIEQIQPDALSVPGG